MIIFSWNVRGFNDPIKHGVNFKEKSGCNGYCWKRVRQGKWISYFVEIVDLESCEQCWYLLEWKNMDITEDSCAIDCPCKIRLVHALCFEAGGSRQHRHYLHICIWFAGENETALERPDINWHPKKNDKRYLLRGFNVMLKPEEASLNHSMGYDLVWMISLNVLGI